MVEAPVEIESALLEKYPGLGILELKINEINVRKYNQDLEQFKKVKQEEIRKQIPSLDSVKDLPVLRAYRDFYWKVGIDPTKTRPAGEALIRRILGGRDLPNVNTLVDSYNIASAESMVAIAAFDASAVDSINLLMRTANKGETFRGIRMGVPISLSGVEVVIEDRLSKKLVAVYPYRDSDESKVTEESREVLFMMCGVPRITRDQLELANRLTLDYVSRFCR
jgi:DNA/RNA-binding domain of Phe-tRNA-synthetase-like protein